MELSFHSAVHGLTESCHLKDRSFRRVDKLAPLQNFMLNP